MITRAPDSTGLLFPEEMLPALSLPRSKLPVALPATPCELLEKLFSAVLTLTLTAFPLAVGLMFASRVFAIALASDICACKLVLVLGAGTLSGGGGGSVSGGRGEAGGVKMAGLVVR